jgi:hypothetical protein
MDTDDRVYYVIRQDVRKTISRFGVFETALTTDAEAPYEGAAREIFAEHPETTIFCFGHTHRPAIREVEGGVVVNSGTWLKRLHRLDGVIGVLPPVFFPSYQLAAVRIAPDTNGVVVEFETVDKPSPKTEELTLTERLLALGREPDPRLPEGVVVRRAGANSVTESESAVEVRSQSERGT